MGGVTCVCMYGQGTVCVYVTGNGNVVVRFHKLGSIIRVSGSHISGSCMACVGNTAGR